MIANWRLAEILGAARNSGSAMSFQSVMTSPRAVAAASTKPEMRMLRVDFMSVCSVFRKRVTTLPQLYRSVLRQTIQGIQRRESMNALNPPDPSTSHDARRIWLEACEEEGSRPA